MYRMKKPRTGLFIVFLCLGSLCYLFFLTIWRGAPSYTGLLKAYPRHDGALFPEIIVHLDLKGAAMKMAAYRELFPVLGAYGATGVLVEYEDMFPYSDELSLANDNQLELIPLVQTFGHLEFLLKHERFRNLSENPTERNTICVSQEDSWRVIKLMLNQIRALHPFSKRIHIGADEAYHVAEDDVCKRRLKKEFHERKDILGLAHIVRVAKYARSLGFETVFAWNDMFQATDADVLLHYEMRKVITPVVWGYKSDVTQPGYFPEGLFARLDQSFDSVYFATAFKGANGQGRVFIDVQRYLNTHRSYVKLLNGDARRLRAKTGGVFVTGWSRYSHHLPLCELLPASIPSLLADLIYLNDTSQSFNDVYERIRERMNCLNDAPEWPTEYHFSENVTYFYPPETRYRSCSFLWSDSFNLFEELRLLTWKSHNAQNVDPVAREKIREEIDVIDAQIRRLLAPLYFPETIDELIKTKVQRLKDTPKIAV
ncbi:unnamed protein product, partial [Mesorhabditis spiculigera]